MGQICLQNYDLRRQVPYNNNYNRPNYSPYGNNQYSNNQSSQYPKYTTGQKVGIGLLLGSLTALSIAADSKSNHHNHNHHHSHHKHHGHHHRKH